MTISFYQLIELMRATFFSRDLFDFVLYLNIVLTATIPNSLTEHLQTDFARLHFRGIFRSDNGIV